MSEEVKENPEIKSNSKKKMIYLSLGLFSFALLVMAMTKKKSENSGIIPKDKKGDLPFNIVINNNTEKDKPIKKTIKKPIPIKKEEKVLPEDAIEIKLEEESNGIE